MDPRLANLLKEILPANRFYARKFAGLPLDDWTKLPFTTKDELLASQATHPPYGELLTYPLQSYTRLHQTSGTQGAPLRWLDTPESWERMLGSWRTMFEMIGVTSADRLLFAFSFGPFLGFWTAFEAASRMGCLCLAAGGLSSGARLRMLLDNRATVVLCTPTYALHLAQFAEQSGVRLEGVKSVIVAGEPGGNIPATRARIEAAFQARVFDHSGMTEIGPLAIECREHPGGLHILEDDYFAEILLPSPPGRGAGGEGAALTSPPVTAFAPQNEMGGERTPSPLAPLPGGEGGIVGELVITNLGRLGSPLLRYRTGDLVRVDPRPCPCGRPWMRLDGGILGRTDDMIAIRGNNVYPSAIENVVRRFAEVVEFRIVVDRSTALAEMRIEIESNVKDATALTARISDAIRDDLMFRADVVNVPPESLPRFEMKARRVSFV